MSGTGILGYGFDEAAATAVALDHPSVDLVGCDAGSTDAGPFYLGTDQPLCSRAAVKRDLVSLLAIARNAGARCVIGSCGGSGTDDQVEWTWQIGREILNEMAWNPLVAVVRSEVTPDWVQAAAREGRVQPLPNAPDLTEDGIETSARIVAMMGVEPLIEALAHGADIVLAGRCSDAALFAAEALRAGVDAGSAWCAGKLLECAATCAHPPTLDSLAADFGNRTFLLYPPNPRQRCTRESVIEQLLHENADPFFHREPGGILNLRDIALVEETSRAVRVSGARFEDADTYTVRLEGVRRRGHRTAVIAGTADPGLIDQITSYLSMAEAEVARLATAMGVSQTSYRLHRHVYGLSGVVGEESRARSGNVHELGLVYDVVGDSSDISQSVAAVLRSTILHLDFPGRKCTEGNVAFPFSPSEFDGGEVFDFSVWHTVVLDDPLQIFPIEYRTPDGE